MSMRVAHLPGLVDRQGVVHHVHVVLDVGRSLAAAPLAEEGGVAGAVGHAGQVDAAPVVERPLGQVAGRHGAGRLLAAVAEPRALVAEVIVAAVPAGRAARPGRVRRAHERRDRDPADRGVLAVRVLERRYEAHVVRVQRGHLRRQVEVDGVEQRRLLEEPEDLAVRRPPGVDGRHRDLVHVVVALAERQAAERIDVVVQGQPELLEVVVALRSAAPPRAPPARRARAARSGPR